MSNRKNMQCGHALDVRIARAYLQTYPAHIEGLIAHSNTAHEANYDRCIRASVEKLVRSARLIYPKRLAKEGISL